MSDPERIVDQDGPGADLLRAARRYQMSERARDRALAAVGVVGAVGAVGATSGVGSLAALKAFFGTKPGVVLLLACSATATAVAAYELSDDGAPPRATGVVQTAVDPTPEPTSPARLPSGASEEPLEAGAIEATPATTTAAPRASVAPPNGASAGAQASRPAPAGAPSSESSLGEELGILDRARAAQRAGDPRAALALLDEHRARFPTGQLTMQAEVLRIEAVAATGDSATARRLADAFLARHPGSVLAPRVSALRAGLR